MKTLTTFQLSWMLDRDDPLVINVLGEEDFELARGRGSPDIPLRRDDLIGEIERWAGAVTRPLLVYCAGPDHRASRTVAQRLEEAGFRNVYYCEGGLKALQSSGWRLAHPTQP